MSGRPQRALPKTCIQVHLDEHAHRQILALFNNPACTFTSISGLVEAMVFLLKYEHIEDAGADLVGMLCTAMQERYGLFARNHHINQIGLHLTIDPEARDFLNLITRKHRNIFLNRNNVLSAMAIAIAHRAETEEKTQWMLRRLEDASAGHPPRQTRSR